MKKENKTSRYIAVLSVLLLLPQLRPGQASAYSPLGYPGSTFGDITRNFNGVEGSGTEGWVRQGATLLRTKGADLNTYAEYSWRMRTKNQHYYTAYGPVLMAALEKGPASLGIEYNWLHYPLASRTSNYAALFGIWYYTTDSYILAGKSGGKPHSPQALPLSSWGRLNYDLQGIEGSGSQGWVKQGADWFSVGRGWMFDTYAAYNWRLRTKSRNYYNAFGPSLGVECSKSPAKIGLEYLWQRFPQDRISTRTFNLYLTWYYGWDLKKK